MDASRSLAIAAVALVAIGMLGSLPYSTPSIQDAHVSGYVRHARHTPFFALPGTDTKKLRRAIEAFKSTASIAVPESISATAQPYPFAFLSSLSDAEDARRTLIGEPSATTTAAYHVALKQVFAAYEADATRISTYLRESPGPTHFGFISGETTSTYIADIVTESLRTVRAFAAEEDARFACAQGVRSACITFPSRPQRALYNGKESGPAQLSVEQTLFRDVLRAYDKESYPGESAVVSLSQSVCYKGEQPMFYDIASTTSRLSGEGMAWMRPLNNLYFHDVTVSDRPSLVELKEAGITYEYQPVNAYMCPDFGIEISEALTILYAHTLFTQRPITASHRDARSLLEAQRKFIGRSMPSQHDFERFVAEAERTLPNRAVFGADDVRRLEELVLLAKTRTAQYERIIGYFDDLQMGSVIFKAPPEGHVGEFMVARGGLSSLLLFFNETGPLPTYTSLVEKAVPTPTLEGDLRSYRGDLEYTIPSSSLLHLFKRNASLKQETYGPRMNAFLQARHTAQ